MEEDVAAADPASRAAFLLASQKKGDVFTLAHLLRRTLEEIAAGGVASSPPTHLWRADLPLGRRKTLGSAPWSCRRSASASEAPQVQASVLFHLGEEDGDSSRGLGFGGA